MLLVHDPSTAAAGFLRTIFTISLYVPYALFMGVVASVEL